MQAITGPRPLRAVFRRLAPLLAMTLAACSALPPPLPSPGSPGWPGGAEQQGAAAAARQGDHARAARLYQQAASARAEPERTDLQLLAAHEWLAAGNAAELERVLAALPAAPSAAQAYERALIEA